VPGHCPSWIAVAREGWLLEREEHRARASSHPQVLLYVTGAGIPLAAIGTWIDSVSPSHTSLTMLRRWQVVEGAGNSWQLAGNGKLPPHDEGTSVGFDRPPPHTSTISASTCTHQSLHDWCRALDHCHTARFKHPSMISLSLSVSFPPSQLPPALADHVKHVFLTCCWCFAPSPCARAKPASHKDILSSATKVSQSLQKAEW
jgi:hypothetical protein